jgi:LytS/YehU family sensor histidine kinase
MSLTIINSIVCVVGACVGLLFAGASIISIANMTNVTSSWRGWLIGFALLLPVAFVVSGIGAWLADAQGATQVVLGLIALPWLYAGVFVLLMVVSFEK